MDHNDRKAIVASPATKVLSQVLKIIDEHPISSTEADESGLPAQLESWINHLIHNSPSPATNQSSDKHDWSGLVTFYQKFRVNEVDLADSSLHSMRDIIWQFAQNVSKNISEDKVDTKKVSQTMSKLHDALDSDSIDTLKAEVKDVIHVLKKQTSEREARYNQQLEFLGNKLREMRSELDNTKAKLAKDGLTGVYNRSALDEHLKKMIEISYLSGRPSCIMMIDIDHFKKINDTYGHQSGDKVLIKLAEVLKETFPRKTDFVARYGGEEFSVIFSEDDARIGTMLAERLCKVVRETDFESDKGEKLSVTVSIGVAEKHVDETLEEWLKRADIALYNAKNSGRDSVCVG